MIIAAAVMQSRSLKNHPSIIGSGSHDSVMQLMSIAQTIQWTDMFPGAKAGGAGGA